MIPEILFLPAFGLIQLLKILLFEIHIEMVVLTRLLLLEFTVTMVQSKTINRFALFLIFLAILTTTFQYGDTVLSIMTASMPWETDFGLSMMVCLF